MRGGRRFSVRKCDHAKKHFQEKWTPVFHPEMPPCKGATGASTSVNELNPDLSIGAPRHPAAAPEPEGELFRNLLRSDRELGAANGNIANYAAQRCRTPAGIDLCQILHIVAGTLATIAEVMEPEQ
jgi:hypothetical protein